MQRIECLRNTVSEKTHGLGFLVLEKQNHWDSLIRYSTQRHSPTIVLSFQKTRIFIRSAICKRCKRTIAKSIRQQSQHLENRG